MKRLFIFTLCIAAGCCGLPPKPPATTAVPSPDFAPASNAFDGAIRRAVVGGLTAVDPAAYNGWRGACPGSDVDAEIFAQLCREQGLEVSFHLNAQATREALVQAARQACQGMRAGDLFVFYISGHGGQVPDTDGDEKDGKDETLCLWDGPLSDDYMHALLLRAPAGLRIFFVTDTCHSGTNYRARSFRRALPRGFAGALIHFGGCDDGLSSYGTAQGGIFTTAMIDAWHDGIGYRAWFDATASKMPGRWQIPVYSEYGAVTDAFRHAPALH